MRELGVITDLHVGNCCAAAGGGGNPQVVQVKIVKSSSAKSVFPSFIQKSTRNGFIETPFEIHVFSDCKVIKICNNLSEQSIMVKLT